MIAVSGVQPSGFSLYWAGKMTLKIEL